MSAELYVNTAPRLARSAKHEVRQIWKFYPKAKKSMSSPTIIAIKSPIATAANRDIPLAPRTDAALPPRTPRPANWRRTYNLTRTYKTNTKVRIPPRTGPIIFIGRIQNCVIAESDLLPPSTMGTASASTASNRPIAKPSGSQTTLYSPVPLGEITYAVSFTLGDGTILFPNI